MGTAPRLAIASAIVGAALLSMGRQAATQRPAGTLSVSAGYASPIGELRRWDAAVDRMVRAGQLVVTSRRADSVLSERTHERLAQHVTGIPVHGGGVSRQLDRGVTVSLLGTLHRDVEVETAPCAVGLPRLPLTSPARPARRRPTAPRLVVLPHGPTARMRSRTVPSGRTAGVHLADARAGRSRRDRSTPAPRPRSARRFGFAGADDEPGSGATDFGAAARLGPRRFTDHSGRAHTCETARLPVRGPRECGGRFPPCATRVGSCWRRPRAAAWSTALLAIFPRGAGVFRTGMGTAAGGAAAGGPPTGDGGWGHAATLADPWSQGAPGAYPFRTELALAADGRSWHYSGFAFRDGRFVEAAGGCCPDGRDRNSAILAHAFHLAVEGGTNRGTGLSVAGAGPAHREFDCADLSPRPHRAAAPGGVVPPGGRGHSPVRGRPCAGYRRSTGR